MPIDFENQIQTYKWTPYNEDIKLGNKLPFIWKCVVCGTETIVNETDATKSYNCSNPLCTWKLKFVM